MTNIPKELLYTENHEWLKLEGDVAWIGLTDYAQSSLGDMVFLDIKEIGTELKSGEALGTVESVKAAEDIYAPVSGKIVEIHSEIRDEPAKINQDPYSSWIVKLGNLNKKELDSLLDAGRYKEYLSSLEE